jgi:hypothetical protein
MVAGRAWAQGGEQERAAIELRLAAAAFDVCGAVRYRAAVGRTIVNMC